MLQVKTLCDCDATVLLNVYIYRMFVGNGWLALVPSHLPLLRELCLDECVNVHAEYVEKLKAALPELIVTNVISWE